jgi:hypothetical protein
MNKGLRPKGPRDLAGFDGTVNYLVAPSCLSVHPSHATNPGTPFFLPSRPRNAPQA